MSTALGPLHCTVWSVLVKFYGIQLRIVGEVCMGRKKHQIFRALRIKLSRLSY